MKGGSKIWIYVKQKFKSNSKATKLQAAEYERRLTSLNHEAARLSMMVPKEHFEVVVNQIKSEIKTIQLWISNQEGRAAKSQLIALCSVVVSILAIILSFFK